MKAAILTGNDSDALYENPLLAGEFDKLGWETEFIDYQQASVLDSDTLMGVQIVSAGVLHYSLPDVIIPRVNEPDPESFARARRFLAVFEALGIPSTISSSSLDICKDKMTTHDALVAAGVPTPRTAKPTTVDASEIVQLLEFVEPNPSRPVVIKKVHGTKGIGVARAGSRKSALPFVQMLIDSEVQILVQQYIETKRNGSYRDIRHVVDWDTIAAAMIRESSNDFRTNLSLNTENIGGISDARGRTARISRQHRELSLGAARAIGGILGVDILQSIRGGAYVDDVNGSTGFRIQNITGKNIAAVYARRAVSLASRQ